MFDADGLVARRSTPFQIRILVTTPSDPGTLYAVESQPGRDEIWRSDDGGISWVRHGVTPDGIGVTRHIAINPRDRLHIVASGRGVAASFDGGTTWTVANGIDQGAATRVTQQIVFGGDEFTQDIWVSGRRTFMDDDREMVTGREEFVARSTDGGLTFNDVFYSGDGIAFNPATHLAPPPGIVGEVLVTNVDCPFLTPRLFHYRASDDSVTILEHGDRRFGFDSIVFHPIDSDILYLGFDEAPCPQ